MTKNWTALALTAVAATACAGPPHSRMSPATTARARPTPAIVNDAATSMASVMDRVLGQAGFQGAFLVAVDERVILAKGYGFSDRAGRVSVTPSTAFWTASIAKSFTATAVMRLAETGRLRLAEPVGAHLTGLPDDWRRMTIAHLLSHTSGIGQNYASDGVADRAAALSAICARPLAHPPGEGWTYSNDAYSVLAMVVEVVSGQLYERYVEREVLARAGLTNTGFWSAPPPRLAELADPALDEGRRASWGFRGGTGIATSAEDLHRWWLGLRAGAVLRPASVALMQSPKARVNDRLSAGYGWFQERSGHGRAVLWTRGTDQSQENAALYALSELGLVVIALSHREGDRDPITKRLALKSIEIFEDALDR